MRNHGLKINEISVRETDKIRLTVNPALIGEDRRTEDGVKVTAIAIEVRSKEVEGEIFGQKILVDDHPNTRTVTQLHRGDDLNASTDKLLELIQGVLKLLDLTGAGGRNDQDAHHITTSALTTLPRSSKKRLT